MKRHNPYRIVGPITFIGLDDKHGKIIAETQVDVADLRKVLDFPYHWRALWCPHTNSYRASAMTNQGGKQRTVYLSRFIIDAPSGSYVDHFNHDTLDNRRANLRLLSNAENLQNRKGPAASNTSSGILNVHFSQQDNKFAVSITRFGKSYPGGLFETRDAAKAKAAELRSNLDTPGFIESLSEMMDLRKREINSPDCPSCGFSGTPICRSPCQECRRRYQRFWARRKAAKEVVNA